MLGNGTGRHRGDRRRSARRRGCPEQDARMGRSGAGASERGEPLLVQHDTAQAGSTFPFGAHVAVVEVDTETGRVVPVQHFAVDDCGVIVNPLLVDGQVHGGLASGIAQALWEQFLYDEDGNPITSTLAEYAFPVRRSCRHSRPHTPRHPRRRTSSGQGIGESATVAPTPAVQNAVIDAVSHLGVRHIDMPCTPERVWRAISNARRARCPIHGGAAERNGGIVRGKMPRARNSSAEPRASIFDGRRQYRRVLVATRRERRADVNFAEILWFDTEKGPVDGQRASSRSHQGPVGERTLREARPRILCASEDARRCAARARRSDLPGR